MVCVKCRRFFRVKKQGVTVEELKPDSSAVATKFGTDEGWSAYKLWQADLFECPTCGAQVVGGFGFHPIVEHYQDGYAATRERLAPVVVRVADCGPSHAGPRPGQGPRPGRGADGEV